MKQGIFGLRSTGPGITVCMSLLVSACTTILAPTPPSSTNQKADTPISWVVLGEQGQAVVRSITGAVTCPLLTQDGNSQIMRVRAAPGTNAQRKTASSADDSKASDFPVLTCEAVLDPGTASASIAGQDLPLPKPVPQKILVIGDSGCRLKKADNYFQPCNDASKWAFYDVIKTAAEFKPDLVIHVGDYHYRENRCPDGNAECAGSPWGYGWDTWRADFFTPATPLLRVAPWVVVRGNHESCTRAGQGWWRLMDPRPLLTGRDCNLQQDDMRGDFSPPYAVPLGKSGEQSAQLIVFDSAKVPSKALAKTDPVYAIYLQQFQIVDQLAEQADFNIFINHHPVLGFMSERKKGDAIEFKPGNAALQDLMQNYHAKRLFPGKVQVALSGHVHLFEAISFKSDHPTQFISGNGGSSLDQALPNQVPAGITPFAGAELAEFNNSNEVGFMTMERQADGWKMQSWDKTGKLMIACLMANGKTTCQPIAP
ncbi:metallophosphoesterase [Undibacterium sp. Jales W-56]|uniref:metallophosphoesterase n=1 Tax=Undibacterium sp. Jales W-56 TaxID=2897325 RepID=UPI0021D292B6|nr:metallophosphoesterase [Undibacterium sp. Jales W-56]MCU6434897.1 metallophosphoesterase [Undibacterium sp. Jales W-56]